jgi:hypothetical protein
MKTLDIAVLAALGIGGLWLFGKFKSGKLDPRSRENIFYQASGEVGLKVADVFPSAAERKVAEMLKVAPTPTAPYIGVPSTGYSGSGLTTTTPATRPAFLPLYGLGRWIE